jgi:hypothetical protein
MKQIRRLGATLALTLIFALPTLAGEISCGITSPPAPASTTSDGGTGIAGEIPNNLAGVMQAALLEAALGFLHSTGWLPS